MEILKISQNFRWRVIFWLPAASNAPALTSQFKDIMPTGRPASLARPTMAVVPHKAPISNQESISTTEVMMTRGSYMRALRRGMIVRRFSQGRSGRSSDVMVGGGELPELGR